jgi:hypothetical protein
MICEDGKPEEKCNYQDTKTRRIQRKTIFFSSLCLGVFVVKSLFFDLAVPAAPNKPNGYYETIHLVGLIDHI